MKAKFLLAVALLIGLQSFAQTPTPYYTGFDTPPQQAGWQHYRKGHINPYDWSVGANPNAPSPPNSLFHDYPVGGAPSLVEDWYVSPLFDFSAGGQIDSFSVNVYSISGTTTPDDHFGIYLLNGSQDPATATVIPLSDMTMLASASNNWTTLYNISIPNSPGNSYIALKYTGMNNWFTPYFDDLGISANPGCPKPSAIVVSPSFLSADFTWPPATGAIGYEIVVDNNSFPPSTAGTPVASTFHTESGLSLNTGYYVHVRTNCGGGMFSSWTTQPFSTLGGPSPCLEPAEFKYSNLTSTQTDVSWKNIPNSEGYEYTLKQDATPPSISGTVALQSILHLSSLTPATKYYLHVRTRCQGITGWDFSNWVATEFFTHFPTAITGTNTSTIKLYPNPATEVLKLEGLNTGTSLAITDMIGKQYLQTQVTESNISLSINELPSGLYLIKLTDANNEQHILKFQKQ